MTDTPTPPRKDKGKAMRPPADATHCGGYPTDTPTPDLTAPEHVDKSIGMCRLHGLHNTEATLRALSAKLEAAKVKSANDKLDIAALRTQVSALRTTCARAKAERDALSRALSYFLATDPDNPVRWEYNREFAERMANKELAKFARQKGGEG